MPALFIETTKFTELITEKVNEWLEVAIKMFPNFVVAVFMLFIFFLLSNLVKRIVSKVSKRVSKNIFLNRLAVNVSRIIVITLGCIVALNILKLEGTVSSLLAGAGIVGLALGFAFKEIAANFMSGVIMAARKPVYVGDIIECNNLYGKVKHIDLRATIIENFDGQIHIVPNKDVFQNTITNYSTTGYRRVRLGVSISYAENLRQVRKVTKEAIEKLDVVVQNEDKDVFFYFTEFNDSSVDFEVAYWIRFPRNRKYNEAVTEGMIAIKEAFDEEGIKIPFPIRTLNFDVKGGQTLQEQIEERKS